MTNQQYFLMDDRKLGRLCKVEIYNVTRKQKGQNVTKKNYVITIYNKVKVQDKIYSETGSESIVEKDKFIKWGEFTFQEVMHPKDKLIQFLSKIEMPIDYIPNTELTDELTRREIVPLHNLSDAELVNEVKRRGLTEFANVFKISKTATIGQKIKAFLKERKKIPATKLSFEETVNELKTRNVILPKDFMTNDELVEEVKKRGLQKSVIADAFPSLPISEILLEPEILEPEIIVAHAEQDKVQEPIAIQDDETPLDLDTIIGKPSNE